MKRFAVGLVLVAACSAGGTAPGGLTRSWKVGPNQTGYTVASASHPNTVLLRGNWNFQIAADSTVTGTWGAYWLSADTLAQVGPQIGSGKLRGRWLGDGTLSVDMNPNQVDNNVLVRVEPTGLSDGTWIWSTLGGPWTGGPFRLDPAPF